jgi:RimJ/RimL family protein N-acetyltransferase
MDNRADARDIPIISDDAICLRRMEESELPQAHEMSGSVDARDFIIAGSLEQYRMDYATPDIVYLSITGTEGEADHGELLGYFILVLDPGGKSVECRRIVVGVKNRGVGKRAMRLLDRYCREILKRERIWLDVYDFNTRGQRVYESTGYRFLRKAVKGDKTLLFYEKLL